MNINYSVQVYSPGEHTISRTYFQYFLILSGSGTLCAGEQEFPLTPHVMLELPPGGDTILKIADTSDITVGIMELQDFYVFQTAVRLIPSSQTELLRKLFFFALELNGVVIPRKAAIHNALDHLVFEAITSTGIIVNSVNPAVYHVIDDITQNYRKTDYDFAFLIGQSGYSFNHFRKLFKDATGITPLSFLQILRIDYAKGLMRRHGHDLPLKEIAERSGFEDPYYFSRLFKKYEKMSPSEYLHSLEGNH